MADSFIPKARPDEQPLDRLAELLLISTGVISTMYNGLLSCARSGGAEDSFDVQQTAHQLIREALIEVDARHSETELTAAIAIVQDALNAICDEMLDGELDHPPCEGRCHTPQLSARRR